MIPRHALLASRIRQELGQLDRVVERVEEVARARKRQGAEPDYLLDSEALNLHGFDAGLERIFTQIASSFDQSTPAGADSHRELLRQMTVEIPNLRPPVLSPEVAGKVDEFLRFRHVVRYNYAFQLDPDRVETLAARLHPTYREVKRDLEEFAAFLDRLADDS